MSEEGRKFLGRSDILAAADLSHEIVEVPEWGGAVRLKTMTGKERHTLQNVVGKLKDQEELVEYLVAASIVDEQGIPIFTFDDVRELGQKSARALNRVFKAAAKLNGMTREAVDSAMGE